MARRRRVDCRKRRELRRGERSVALAVDARDVQQGGRASDIGYVVVSGSAEALVDDVWMDAGGSGPCAALYGAGTSDHRA